MEINVTKAAAAQAQLESAILLWFTREDAISVHTLVVAAHDCYHGLSSHQRGQPSFVQAFLKEQSKTFQNRFRSAQNFFSMDS
jgi:hypothetical protein